MHDNEKTSYWLEEFSETVETLATVLKRDPSTGKEDVAHDLAYIAGDHYDMNDDEVLATYINENF